jgi:uncharacterized protein YjdB
LNKVLFPGSSTQTIVGRPIVPDAAVHAIVEEHVSVTLILLSCVYGNIVNQSPTDTKVTAHPYKSHNRPSNITI